MVICGGSRDELGDMVRAEGDIKDSVVNRYYLTVIHLKTQSLDRNLCLEFRVFTFIIIMTSALVLSLSLTVQVSLLHISCHLEVSQNRSRVEKQNGQNLHLGSKKKNYIQNSTGENQ